MLDAHPALAIPTETHFLGELLDLRPDERTADRVCDVITGAMTWPNMPLDAPGSRAAVGALDPFSLGDAVRTFYERYAARFAKPRGGDKPPPYRARIIAIT